MLQSPAENSCATLITQFVNAVHEIVATMARNPGRPETLSLYETEIAQVLQYLGTEYPGDWKHGPRIVLIDAARGCIRDGDALFEE